MAKIPGFVCSLVILVCTALGMGLCLVWFNIESIDLAYDIKKLESELGERAEVAAKLEVERDNLASPYRLRGLAQGFGLGPAQSGQIRRMGGMLAENGRNTPQ
jgi:cell division protein FtsL